MTPNTLPSPHTQAMAALQSAANQILAVLAPASARLVRVMVVLESQAQTASTDGHIVIVLPTAFSGHPLPEDDAVAVGLLAHEAGHFVQPLEQVLAVEEKHDIPHWLANVALDIHGESFVEGVFPAMTEALKATRQAVNDVEVSGYRQSLETATDFSEAAPYAALMGRFSRPKEPFCPDWLDRQWWNKPWYGQMVRFLDELEGAAYLAPEQLPDFLVQLIQQYPELKQAPLPELPDYGHTEADKLGQIVLGEAQQGSEGCSPGGAGQLQVRSFSTRSAGG